MTFINLVEPLAEEIKSRAGEFERQGYVSQDVVQKLAERRLYRLCNDTSSGGLSGTAEDYARLTEYVATLDGSTAWVLFIGITSALSYMNLPEEEVKGIFKDQTDITAGVFAPMGRATPDQRDGVKGYRLSGRWQWGSGIRNSTFISAGGFVVGQDGKIQRTQQGLPDQRMFLLDVKDVDILDTWHVSGLKGTGSTDFQTEDLFVPESRAFTLFSKHTPDTPVHRFPAFGFLAIGIAAVALGLAKASLDELTAIAIAKTPQGSRKPLAMRSSTQIRVALATAKYRAARGLMYEEIRKIWSEAETSSELSVEARRDLRLALTYTVMQCVEVVTEMYTLAGGSSVYETSPLQRYFRDIHVAQQHMMVGEMTLELTGRLFLDVETDTSQL